MTHGCRTNPARRQCTACNHERTSCQTALRKAHDELDLRVKERTAELQRQAELLSLTHDAIIARDLNQRVFFWNRGAEELYGWTSDEVKGKVTDELAPDDSPRPWQEIEEELLLRGRWEGEVIHTTRDGRKIIVASRRALRRDKDGKPIAILEINSDITEQRRSEEQLRQGTEDGSCRHPRRRHRPRLQQHPRGNDRFLGDGVDEIPADNAPVQRHMKRVLKAGLTGERTRQADPGIQPQRAKGNENRSALRPWSTRRTRCCGHPCRATIQMPLAITTSDDYVLADPTQLQQVLMNLATNAAHAMREDGGQLTIGVSSVTFPQGSLLPDPDMEPGTYVKLTVKDTGTGMTEEVRQRIFEPFFTTKEQGKGTGMGLAVVYGIVKSSRGRSHGAERSG